MPFESFTLRDFRGGLDLVSSKPNIPQGFSPNAWNYTINEDGGLEKMLGWDTFATATSALRSLHTFRFSANERLIGMADTSILSFDSDGVETVVQSGRSSNAETSFAVAEDTMYAMDDDNDLMSWDGSTVTTYPPGVTTGPNRGRILDIWNGRIYTVTATNQMRVEWSQPFDPEDWPTDNNLRLTSIDDLGTKIIGGQTVAGGILIFTDEAVFKIYTPDGNYTVLSNDGCTNRDSIAMVNGLVYWMSKDGIMATDGNDIPVNVTDRVDVMFRNHPNLDSAAGVGIDNKYLCSFSRLSFVNEITLEFDPRNATSGTVGSIMANEIPALSWANTRWDLGNNAYFVQHNATTKIRKAFASGSSLDADDVEQDIDCHYETAPLDMGVQDTLKRIVRARVVGRGDMLMACKPDYLEDEFDSVALDLPILSGDLWDTMLWDTGEWAGWTIGESIQRVTRRGRTFSFIFSESSKNTGESRNQLNRSGQITGATSILIVEPHFVFNTRRMR